MRDDGRPRVRNVILTLFLFLLVAALPLRDALTTGGVAGSGPDITVTLWGMWWFSEEWTGPAWAGVSTLANYPSGTVGTVLAPFTSTVWAVFAALFGNSWAVTLTDLVYLTAWCATVAWLARLSGVRWPAAIVAGALAMSGRYLVYAVGETSIVGVTALPALMCAISLLEYRARGTRRWLALFVVSAAALGVEYPYLVPLPPLLGALAFAERRDRKVLAATLLGTVVLLLAVKLAGRGQVSFGSGRTGNTVPLFGLAFPAAEDLVARATLRDRLWPKPVVWSLGGVDGTLRAGGREFVGLALLVAAAAGAWVRRTRATPWLVVGLGGMVLASGSDWAGFASPFALLNSVAAQVVRALTQPTRFLVLTSAALPIAAAHLVDHLAARPRWAAGLVGVLFVESLAFGGLSLRIPVTSLPSAPCVAALADLPRTAVVTLPWDGLSDGGASIHAREWQMLHGQAGPVFGVGSWTLVDDRIGTAVLDELLVGPALAGNAKLEGPRLRLLGYTHLVVDMSVGGWLHALVLHDLGPATTECEGAAVWALDNAPVAMVPVPLANIPSEWRERASIRANSRVGRAGAPIQ